MRDLIERLEKATGPDRELDGDIAVAVHGGEIVWKMANYTMESHPARRHPSKMHIGGFANEHVPHYTASLDAALTLVPEGWGWDRKNGRMWVRQHSAVGEPALALCIAALRARAASVEARS